jgi:hypothetical protein
MTPKTIATLLILSAFATTGANSASAEGGGFPSGGFNARDGGGIHGRGHYRRPPVIVGGFVGLDDYGDQGGYGNQASREGSGNWYGISDGHDDCPLFRKRVKTPDGWQIQMIPVC